MSDTAKTRTYYDSPTANAFYSTVWGGQNICIGLYTLPSPSPFPSNPTTHPSSPSPPPESIPLASHRTVSRLASFAQPITPKTRVIDLGAGYGGAARYLAKTYGCHVTCLNLSGVQNQRNGELCLEEGVGGLVSIVEGAFEDLPFEDDSFDICWSQDAFLHSVDRQKLVAEIGRVVVKKGGTVVFTDIMEGPGKKEGGIEEYLKRLPVKEVGTREGYEGLFEREGFRFMEGKESEGEGWLNWTEHLVVHYEKVREGFVEYEAREGGKEGWDKEWAERVKRSLVDAADASRGRALVWGCFRYAR